MGKGLNHFNYDYQEAWGDELQNGWGNGDDYWWGEDWQQGNGMNVMMMMLEKGKQCETTDRETEIETERVNFVGEHDRLTNKRRGEPITLHNQFSAFQTNIDTDDEDDDYDPDDGGTEACTSGEDAKPSYSVKRNPNKRQRQRRKESWSVNNKGFMTDLRTARPQLPQWQRHQTITHANITQQQMARIRNSNFDQNQNGHLPHPPIALALPCYHLIFVSRCLDCLLPLVFFGHSCRVSVLKVCISLAEFAVHPTFHFLMTW